MLYRLSFYVSAHLGKFDALSATLGRLIENRCHPLNSV